MSNNVINNLNRVFNNSIPDTVMFHPEIMLLDLRIYAIIKSFMDTHNACFPSNKWLSTKLNVHQNSIPRSITKLETLGFVERLEINGQRQLVTKQYPIALKGNSLDPNLEVNDPVDKEGGVNIQVKGGLTCRLRGVNLQVNHNRSKSSRSKSKIDSIEVRSDFNESEQIIRDMVIAKIGDHSFSYRQAAFLLSLHTNDGKSVTIDGIVESLENYINFLTNNRIGKTVRNKVAYFIKAMKVDGYFFNHKQFTKDKEDSDRPKEDTDRTGVVNDSISGLLINMRV